MRIAGDFPRIGPAAKRKQYDTAPAPGHHVGDGQGQRPAAANDGERAASFVGLVAALSGHGHASVSVLVAAAGLAQRPDGAGAHKGDHLRDRGIASEFGLDRIEPRVEKSLAEKQLAIGPRIVCSV